jgi:hypothetical protein
VEVIAEITVEITAEVTVEVIIKATSGLKYQSGLLYQLSKHSRGWRRCLGT